MVSSQYQGTPLQEEFLTSIVSVWADLSPDERRCVWTYSMSESKAEAARSIGKDAKWLENRQARHPAFRAAMDANWRPDMLTAWMIPELNDLCVKTLTEMIEDPESPPKTRLNTVRLAPKLQATIL